MNTLNSRITYLWQQFSARKATRAELDELMELLSSGSHDDESREYLLQLLEATPAGEEDPARWEPVLQSILHPVRTLDPITAGTGGPSRIRRLVRTTMTAAAIVLLCIGLFRLWQTYRSPGAVPVAAVAEVAPGSNKAVLTLAGGQQIILDSAASGILAEQGNTHVQKLGNGELAYVAGSQGKNANENTGQAGGKGGRVPYTLTTSARRPVPADPSRRNESLAQRRQQYYLSNRFYQYGSIRGNDGRSLFRSGT